MLHRKDRAMQAGAPWLECGETVGNMVVGPEALQVYCISDPLMGSQSVQGVSGGCQPVVQAAALQGGEQGAATQGGRLGCPLRFLSPG